MKWLIGVLAALAIALGVAPVARADEKIPNPNCSIYSACWQSYQQGRQWTFDEWRYGYFAPRRAIEILGTPDHPEKAAAFCHRVLANAYSTGNVRADTYYFLGACHDFVLQRWVDDGMLNQLVAIEAMVHG